MEYRIVSKGEQAICYVEEISDKQREFLMASLSMQSHDQGMKAMGFSEEESKLTYSLDAKTGSIVIAGNKFALAIIMASHIAAIHDMQKLWDP